MNSTFMRRRSDGDDAKARFHCANRVLGGAGNQEWGGFVAESCFCGNVMWYGSRVSRVP